MSDYEGREITEEEAPDKIIKVWCISPHESCEYDYCIERDYHKAREIALSTVEFQMDQSENDDIIEVKIWTETMRLDDYNELIKSTT